MGNKPYKCPYCNQFTTVTNENSYDGGERFGLENRHGIQFINHRFKVCTNPDCREYSLEVLLHDAKLNPSNGKLALQPAKKIWQLIPTARMEVFPSYVPKVIVDDYTEACQIRDLSPKASATLSRRCLQGIIRDFWKVSKNRLIDEIEAIKEKVDPTTWSAIDAVRRIGNICAHMEKDIDLVIEVNKEEADLLIGLIEILVKDWYINKHERDQNLKKLVAASEQKALQQQGVGEPNT